MRRQLWALGLLAALVAGALNGLGVDHAPAVLIGVAVAAMAGLSWTITGAIVNHRHE